MRRRAWVFLLVTGSLVSTIIGLYAKIAAVIWASLTALGGSILAGVLGSAIWDGIKRVLSAVRPGGAEPSTHGPSVKLKPVADLPVASDEAEIYIYHVRLEEYKLPGPYYQVKAELTNTRPPLVRNLRGSVTLRLGDSAVKPVLASTKTIGGEERAVDISDAESERAEIFWLENDMVKTDEWAELRQGDQVKMVAPRGVGAMAGVNINGINVMWHELYRLEKGKNALAFLHHSLVFRGTSSNPTPTIGDRAVR